jgi:uncharacterized protein YndB with AHSA1/START domain
MAVDTIAPVMRSITVERSPEDAFRIFTERIADWWPLRTHSVYGAEAASAAVEPGVGGRLLERSLAGEESSWGEILVWEPPHRLAYTWHPGYEEGDPVTEVEIRFTAVGEATRVDVEHRGWEALGERAEETRAGYAEGWPLVLASYAAATTA